MLEPGPLDISVALMNSHHSASLVVFEDAITDVYKLNTSASRETKFARDNRSRETTKQIYGGVGDTQNSTVLNRNMRIQRR
jgi:hypothetical protein